MKEVRYDLIETGDYSEQIGTTAMRRLLECRTSLPTCRVVGFDDSPPAQHTSRSSTRCTSRPS